MATTLEIIGEHRCHGGVQGFYRHASNATGTEMSFAVFQPPHAASGNVPVLYYLAGLTCTEETATIKAGAQRLAAELGLMLVMPDTSPRGANIPGEDDDWDYGTGAGFYVDATQAPWSEHYRMQSYVVDELRDLIATQFSAKSAACGIFGHSMGGHGALTLALKFPEIYRSVSAFAPICAPMECPWGEKAFNGYLGEDRESWSAHDASWLIRSGRRQSLILVDQGESDQFLEVQLHPHRLREACAQAGQPLELHMREGYNHSYYFIQSFMENHLRHHASILNT